MSHRFTAQHGAAHVMYNRTGIHRHNRTDPLDHRHSEIAHALYRVY